MGLELNLAKDAMNSEKSFCRYVSHNTQLLMRKNGRVVTTDEEKAEALSNVFASI